MTSDQIKDIINYAVLVLGAAATVTISVWRYFAYQEVKIKENSFGAKKVRELEEAIVKLQEEIKLLKIVIDNFREKLDDLSGEFKELMKQIYSNFLGRR